MGNGSDEVLALAFLAFFAPEDRIAFPKISYSFYPVYADLFAVPYDAVALREDFSLDAGVFAGDYKGIVFANPNAPTGMAMPLDQVEQILREHTAALVVVDEAYVDFGGESAVGLVERYPNLLVVQTFSKSRSLAGLRIGFAMGQQPLIEALSTVKNSFNSYTLDRLAQAGALRERKILVRYFNTPGIDRFLRITVGTDAEMDALLSALGDSLKAI